jgi:hypothetical protein
MKYARTMVNPSREITGSVNVLGDTRAITVDREVFLLYYCAFSDLRRPTNICHILQSAFYSNN